MEPYYDDGTFRIYHGDCRAVMASLPPLGADLVFTSPPYNLGNTSGGGMPGKNGVAGHYDPAGGMKKRGGMGKWSGGALADGYGEYGDNLPHEEYVAWQKGVLLDCWRHLGEEGAIYYNHKPRIFDGECVLPTAYNPGLPLRQEVIWKRAGGVNFSPAFYLPTHERILVLAKPAFRLKSKGASGAGDVWDVPQESNTPHEAPFPVALPSIAIETTGARVVLDPFLGSGTTLVAAKRLGAGGVGIELRERWCEHAARRLEAEPEPIFREVTPPAVQGALF